MKQAIYAGSFDPITNGHIDIIERAQKLFTEIHVGVIKNLDKAPLFTVEERISMIRKLFRPETGISVSGFKGLLVDFARKKKIFTIIRGLRAVSDFDYELQMALTNRKLEARLDTVFLMTDAKYSFLSSSLVRQIAAYQGDVSPFVPKIVEKTLKEKFLS